MELVRSTHYYKALPPFPSGLVVAYISKIATGVLLITLITWNPNCTWRLRVDLYPWVDFDSRYAYSHVVQVLNPSRMSCWSEEDAPMLLHLPSCSCCSYLGCYWLSSLCSDPWATHTTPGEIASRMNCTSRAIGCTNAPTQAWASTSPRID